MFSVRSSPELPEWVIAIPGTVGFIPVALDSKLSSFKSWSPAADEQLGPRLSVRRARIAPVPPVEVNPSAALLARVEAAVARARSRWTRNGERELARLLGELARDPTARSGLAPQQLQVIMEGLRAHRSELPRSWVYQAVGALAQVIGADATPEHVRLLVQPMGWTFRDGRPSPRADAHPAYAGSALVRILCRHLGGANMVETLGPALLEAALAPLHVHTNQGDWLVHAYGVLADYVAGLDDAGEKGGGSYIDAEADNRHLGWILDAVLKVKFSYETQRQAEQAAQRAQLLKALCDPDGLVGALYGAVRWWLPPRLFPKILTERARVADSPPAKAHWDRVLKALLRETSILRPLVQSLAGIDDEHGRALVWRAVGMREDGKQDLKFRTRRLDVAFSSERDGPLSTLLGATRGQGLRTLLLAIQGSFLNPRYGPEAGRLSKAAVQEWRQRVIHRMLGLLAAYPNDQGPEGPALIFREALHCHASLGGQREELVARLDEWWSENPMAFPIEHATAFVLAVNPPPASAPAHEQLGARVEQWRNWFNTHRRDVSGRSAMHVLLVLLDQDANIDELRRVHKLLFGAMAKAPTHHAVTRAIVAEVDFHEAVWDLHGLSLWPDSPHPDGEGEPVVETKGGGRKR